MKEKPATIISEIRYDVPLPEQRAKMTYPLGQLKVGGSFTITSETRSNASIRNSVYAAFRSFKNMRPNRRFIIRKTGENEFTVGRIT